MGTRLSAAASRRLRASFGQGARARARRLLEERCGEDLPGLVPGDVDTLERVRVAALKVSGGSLAKLSAALERAAVDWRDLLVEAGFADDPHAHEAWEPSAARRRRG
jgi:hypothetical protein